MQNIERVIACVVFKNTACWSFSQFWCNDASPDAVGDPDVIAMQVLAHVTALTKCHVV